jgi:hypothetical protein
MIYDKLSKIEEKQDELSERISKIEEKNNGVRYFIERIFMIAGWAVTAYLTVFVK